MSITSGHIPCWNRGIYTEYVNLPFAWPLMTQLIDPIWITFAFVQLLPMTLYNPLGNTFDNFFFSWTYIHFSRMSLSFDSISYFLFFNLSLILHKVCFRTAYSYKSQHIYSSFWWQNNVRTISRLAFEAVSVELLCPWVMNNWNLKGSILLKSPMALLYTSIHLESQRDLV